MRPRNEFLEVSYYSSGDCSMALHIVLRESGLPFDLFRASTKTHQIDDGTDYYMINDKGSIRLTNNGQMIVVIELWRENVFVCHDTSAGLEIKP